MAGIAALSAGSDANGCAPTVPEREFRPRALAAAETFGIFVLRVAAFVMAGDVCSVGALKV
jgi:hypothetical protein